MLAPNNGDFTFSVHTTGKVQLWIGDDTVPLTLKPDAATNEQVSAPITLKADELYSLRLELTNLMPNAIAELYWQSATLPKAIIPSDNLYPRALFDNFAAAYTRLQKAALIVNGFQLGDREIAYFSDHPSDFDGFDLNALPLERDTATPPAVDQNAPNLFKTWRRVNSYTTLRNNLPKGEVSLIDLFSAASPDDAKAALVKASGWDAPTVEALAGTKGFNLAITEFKNEIQLIRLQDCVRLIKRLGVSADQLFHWASQNTDFAELQKIAQAIKRTVRAKYDDAAWTTVARPLTDKLRESQKAALIAYVLTLQTIRDANVRTSNQLFEYFLIDVDMSACMMTSRIKQGISSVQLFVHRCLMNLEPQVGAVAIDLTVWQWMKHYRIWEANRKVFLYPENWIEPELRDGKTPFFRELESELLQNDLTMDTAETAFLNYLEKLDEVARLEICGMYWQETDPDTNEPINILHVFGRTLHTRHVYYYRQLINNASWTAWEKVQVDIEGDHLIPVVWNRRLHIFWPIFTAIAAKPGEMGPSFMMLPIGGGGGGGGGGAGGAGGGGGGPVGPAQWKGCRNTNEPPTTLGDQTGLE